MVGHTSIFSPIARTFFNLGFATKKINRDVIHVDQEGTSGTDIFGGRFSEEYLQKLLGQDAIPVFDEMRRSDGQVAMLLSVVKSPIKSASWSIEAVDDSDEERNVADFAKHVLFDDLTTSDGQKKKKFKELLSEILTCVDFGHSVFEIVHKVVKGHPKFGDYIGYADIGFRHQRTIEEWILRENGSIDWIRQLVQGDLAKEALIAGEHLMVCSINKEGDNYEGISMLRPCYGAWFRKNLYKKFQAIGIERASLGLLHGKMSEEMFKRADYENQRSAFQTLLNHFSSHESNAIVTAPGLDIDSLKIEHDPAKVQLAIKAENVEMSKAFLVTFMEMGIEGGGGSYSLGSDLSDIFLSGIDFIGDMIADKLDDTIIKPIIDMKFGPREAYPKIRHKGINDKAGQEFAGVMKTLGEAGVLQVSDRIKKHVHELYNLPDFDPDLEDELKEDDDENTSHADDETGSSHEDDEIKQSSHRKKDKKKLSDFDFDSAYQNISDPLIKAHGGRSLSTFEDNRLDEMIYSAAFDDVLLAELLPSVFIARNAQKLEEMLRVSIKERSDKMISKMINIIRRDSNARSAALSVTMPDSNKFKSALRSFTGEVGQKALSKVLRELETSINDIKLTEEEFRDLPNKSKKRLTQEIILTAQFLDSDVEKVVLFSFNGLLDETDSPDVLQQKLIRSRDRFMIGPSIKAVSVNMTSKITNGIRTDVFQEPEILDNVESFVFTNPSPVSAICQNLTGRVFSKEEFATTPHIPPLHHNCWQQGTEIYTQNGWKLFEDLDIDEDTFLSLNPDNFDLEYVKAHRYIARPFKGELYHFTNNQGSVSQCVTPDHPMVYMKRVDHGKAGKIKEWTESDIKTFIAHGSEAYIYCSSEWKGTSKESIEINGKKYPIKPFLKMMGYYLSEGSRHKNFIVISQFHKENLATIKKDMESFGFNVWKSGIAFKDESLYEWLSQFGKSYQKYVPEIIKELSPDHLRIFLDAFCLGDGCTYKDRQCFTGKTTYRMFATSSHRMAGDITELLIKIGRSASMRIVSPKGTETKHKNGTYTSNHDVWGIFDLSSKTRRVTKIERIPYDGIVYDVSLVKNRTLLIKHNGCISWGSNCKSFIFAQTSGKRGNKPVSPNELQIVGTSEQVAKARKSITL